MEPVYEGGVLGLYCGLYGLGTVPMTILQVTLGEVEERYIWTLQSLVFSKTQGDIL